MHGNTSSWGSDWLAARRLGRPVWSRLARLACRTGRGRPLRLRAGAPSRRGWCCCPLEARGGNAPTFCAKHTLQASLSSPLASSASLRPPAQSSCQAPKGPSGEELCSQNERASERESCSLAEEEQKARREMWKSNIGESERQRWTKLSSSEL